MQVYDVFDDCGAVLGKTDDHGSQMLVFTKGKKTIIDQGLLHELVSEPILLQEVQAFVQLGMISNSSSM